MYIDIIMYTVYIYLYTTHRLGILGLAFNSIPRSVKYFTLLTVNIEYK